MAWTALSARNVMSLIRSRTGGHQCARNMELNTFRGSPKMLLKMSFTYDFGNLRVLQRFDWGIAS
jgi:hypothetical protein